MVFKKDLTPLRKGGEIIKHQGKGGGPYPPPSQPFVSNLAGGGINDYAKATPMAKPAAPGAKPESM